MISEKIFLQSKNRIKKLIQNKKILTNMNSSYTNFFLKNAENSLDSAKLLYDISNDKSKQKSLGYTSFNGYLWVLNSSYYSICFMFQELCWRVKESN